MSVLQQLNELMNETPNLNNKVARQQQAAQQIQAASAVGQRQGTQNTVTDTQSLGTALTQAKGQTQQEAQQKTTQSALQGAGNVVNAQGQQNEAELAQRKTADQNLTQQTQREASVATAERQNELRRDTTKEELAKAERLTNLGIEQNNDLLQIDLKTKKQLNDLGNDLNQKLFDSRRQFQNDELGRKFSNERQLADYAVLTAKNRQDLERKLKDMQRTAQRKAYILEAAQQRLIQTLAMDTKRQTQKISQESQREIAEMASKAKKQAQRAKAQAGAIGNIVSGTITGFASGGGPAGAAIGFGMGVGSAAAGGAFK